MRQPRTTPSAVQRLRPDLTITSAPAGDIWVPTSPRRRPTKIFHCVKALQVPPCPYGLARRDWASFFADSLPSEPDLLISWISIGLGRVCSSPVSGLVPVARIHLRGLLGIVKPGERPSSHPAELRVQLDGAFDHVA